MKILGENLLTHPRVEKKQLFLWITQILTQLQAREQIGKLPDTITPFDIALQKNKIAILIKQRRGGSKAYLMLNKFVPRHGQNSSIYSFGKTLQFLFAKTELTPRMTRQEELRFRKIISKCLTCKSKNKYLNFSEIKINPPKKKKIHIKLLFYLASVCAGVFLVPRNQISKEEEQRCLELGLSYFLLQENYEKSEELFGQVKSKQIGMVLKEISSYMEGNSSETDFEMELALNEATKMLEVQQNWQNKASVVIAYEKVDTPNARKQIRQLAKEVISESTNRQVKRRMREILANVYLREGEYENAVREYRTLLAETDYQEICKTIDEIEKKTR